MEMYTVEINGKLLAYFVSMDDAIIFTEAYAKVNGISKLDTSIKLVGK